jgi:hypothetical protein
MAYTRKWTRLGDALTYIVATGVSEPQAKNELCQAIADRVLFARVRIADSDPDLGGAFVQGELRIAIPDELFPRDFNWAASRPIKKWSAGTSSNPNVGWLFRGIEYLEVDTPQLHEIWPDPAPRSPEKPQAQKVRRLPKSSMEAWYRARVRTWPSNMPPPSADRDLIDAREAFPNHTIAREMIRVARAALAPQEWTGSGRRRKLAPK